MFLGTLTVGIVSPVIVGSMCYIHSMSIAELTDLFRTLLKGIKAGHPINPIVHANLFQEKIELDLDGEFFHVDGVGHVVLDEEKVVLVHWVDDGVYFDDHTFHDDLLKIIRAALNTLNEIGERPDDDDEESESLDWI